MRVPVYKSSQYWKCDWPISLVLAVKVYRKPNEESDDDLDKHRTKDQSWLAVWISIAEIIEKDVMQLAAGWILLCQSESLLEKQH